MTESEEKRSALSELQKLDCCPRCILKFLYSETSEAVIDTYLNPKERLVCILIKVFYYYLVIIFSGTWGKWGRGYIQKDEKKYMSSMFRYIGGFNYRTVCYTHAHGKDRVL